MKTGLCCLIVPPPVSPFPLHFSPAAFVSCLCEYICCLNRCEEWASQQSIAEPLLFYTTAAVGCATSPGWAACPACTHTHMHWRQSVLRCHQHSQATWAAQGEGQMQGTSAVKYWWIHLPLLTRFASHGFADRANTAVALHLWGRNKLTWGPHFRMPQASAQAGVWPWAQGKWRFPLSFADIACGRHWTAPALLNMLQFSPAAAGLPDLLCVLWAEDTQVQPSSPRDMEWKVDIQRKDTYVLLFLKSDLCFYHYHANILKIQANSLIPFPPASACMGVPILSPV